MKHFETKFVSLIMNLKKNPTLFEIIIIDIIWQ